MSQTFSVDQGEAGTPIEQPDGPLPIHDFGLFLHELCTREMRRMPPGARKVRSGGCLCIWSFEWFKGNYPA
jgi:hypothetical protein